MAGEGREARGATLIRRKFALAASAGLSECDPGITAPPFRPTACSRVQPDSSGVLHGNGPPVRSDHRLSEGSVLPLGSFLAVNMGFKLIGKFGIYFTMDVKRCQQPKM